MSKSILNGFDDDGGGNLMLLSVAMIVGSGVVLVLEEGRDGLDVG